MYLIVGLGNPGREYDNTRHNIGFQAIDLLAERYNAEVNRIKFKGVYGETTIYQEKVILLKPNTYMNLSGESLIQAANFFKIDKEKIIVLYDDTSLDIGRLRIRQKGSAGGHNGIKNIILHLNSDEFPRIKIGVGQPKHDMVSHVLGKFSKEEQNSVQKVLEVSLDAVETIIKTGVTEAMNKFNGFEAK